MPKPSYKSILEIKPYKPGEVAKKSEAKEAEAIKLSSNENPLGCSGEVKKEITQSFSKLGVYPDGGAIELRQKIKDTYNLKSIDNIICGAGSDEVITLICMAYAANGGEVIYTKHGFLMYPISTLAVGGVPVIAEEADLKTDVDAILSNVTDKTSLVFIANPNNPTGSYIGEGEIRRLRENLPDDVILVLDLAYAEYAEDVADYPDAVKLVGEFDNIIMLRTFSKAYGIPNLRLGWGYANDRIIDVLNRVRGPFNVSGLSQAAGVAALEDQEFIKKSVELNNSERAKLEAEFKSLGIKTYPSIANFILVDFDSEDRAVKLDAYLRERNITGRMMQAYKLPSCIRFTIGLEKQNEKLIRYIKEFIK